VQPPWSQPLPAAPPPLAAEYSLLVDQRFLPRISEGEVRVFMLYDRPVGVLHKQPAEGQVSATLFSGARCAHNGGGEGAAQGGVGRGRGGGKMVEAMSLHAGCVPMVVRGHRRGFTLHLPSGARHRPAPRYTSDDPDHPKWRELISSWAAALPQVGQ
jgi:hypothetical protein